MIEQSTFLQGYQHFLNDETARPPHPIEYERYLGTGQVKNPEDLLLYGDFIGDQTLVSLACKALRMKSFKVFPNPEVVSFDTRKTMITALSHLPDEKLDRYVDSCKYSCPSNLGCLIGLIGVIALLPVALPLSKKKRVTLYTKTGINDLIHGTTRQNKTYRALKKSSQTFIFQSFHLICPDLKLPSKQHLLFIGDLIDDQNFRLASHSSLEEGGDKEKILLKKAFQIFSENVDSKELTLSYQLSVAHHPAKVWRQIQKEQHPVEESKKIFGYVRDILLLRLQPCIDKIAESMQQ